MENATKALLIAGAVLIVILLIGVGMLIFNSSTRPVQTAVTGMEAHEKEIFNAQFENYAGTQTGTNVKQLLSKVISSNAVYDNDVSVTNGTTAKADAAKLRTYVKLSQKYTIELTYNDGVVSTVTITPGITLPSGT